MNGQTDALRVAGEGIFEGPEFCADLRCQRDIRGVVSALSPEAQRGCNNLHAHFADRVKDDGDALGYSPSFVDCFDRKSFGNDKSREGTGDFIGEEIGRMKLFALFGPMLQQRDDGWGALVSNGKGN